MKKSLLFFFTLILFMPSLLFSKSYQINLDETVALAIKGNLSLKVQEVALKTKERNKKWVATTFLPTINFTPAFSANLIPQSDSLVLVPNVQGATSVFADGKTIYSSPPINAVSISGNDLPVWATSLGLQVSLPINAAMFIAIDTVKKDYENGLISYATAEAQLERDVKKSYYNLILLKQSLSLLESNLESAQRRYAQAQRQYNLGVVPKIQMLSAQATVENLKPQLTASRHYYDVAIMNFKIYLGLEFEDEIELTDSTLTINELTLDMDKLISENIHSRLDIALLKGNLDYLKKSKTASLVGALTPSLIFGLNYNAATALYKNDSPLKPDTTEWNKSSSFSVAISVPVDKLIYGSSAYKQGYEIQDSITSLDIQLTNALRMAELDLRNTYNNLNKSKENIDSLTFNIKLNQELFDESEKGYKAGRVDILDLEDAENRLHQARLNLIQEQVNYLSTVVDLEYALNTKIK